jgi:hypothetical protein
MGVEELEADDGRTVPRRREAAVPGIKVEWSR